MSAKKRNRPFLPKKEYAKQKAAQKAHKTGDVFVDYDQLPEDLDAEAIEDLFDALPKSTRKTKPKAKSYRELQGLTLNELFERAEDEKVDLEGMRKRRDVVWAIVKNWIEKRIPVAVEGCIEISEDDRAFIRNRVDILDADTIDGVNQHPHDKAHQELGHQSEDVDSDGCGHQPEVILAPADDRHFS